MPWIPDRPGTYNEAEVYDEESGTWGSVDGKAGRDGSKYRDQLVAIGSDDNGNGVIYFGAFE